MLPSTLPSRGSEAQRLFRPVVRFPCVYGEGHAPDVNLTAATLRLHQRRPTFRPEPSRLRAETHRLTAHRSVAGDSPPPPSRPNTPSAEWRSSPGSSCVAAEHWQPVRPPACRLSSQAQRRSVIGTPVHRRLEKMILLAFNKFSWSIGHAVGRECQGTRDPSEPGLAESRLWSLHD